MKYTSLLLLPTLASLSFLCATDQSRNDQWHEIWQRKGQKALEKEQALYEADGYEVVSEENWQAMVRRLLIKADIQKAKSVCEFGCGAGALLDVAHTLSPGLHLYGFDYTSSLIDVAKKRFPSGHFWVQSITENLPEEISKLSFDATICSGVFIYIDSEKDVQNALKNMLEVTKQGGKIILGDISDLGKKDLAMKLRGETHVNTSAQVAPGAKLDHLYLSREFFFDFAKENNLAIEFAEYSEIDPNNTYPNGQYRFCLIMTKKAKN